MDLGDGENNLIVAGGQIGAEIFNGNSTAIDVRANALKRIEAALKKMNLQFADGKQTVLIQPGG